MDAETLKNRMGQEGLRLIDVRTPAEFESIHIAGSELMPLDRLKPEELRGHSCVLICRSGKRATDAKRQIAAAGCGAVDILDGGVTAWEQAGLPVIHGRAAISLERQVRIAAGILVLTGIVLGLRLHPGFFGLSAFVGAGLIFAGVTDWCGMAMMLAKAPWNQRGAGNG